MNPFGWKRWKELPYRGDGLPRSSKRRRRFANRKKEIREITIIILVVLIGFLCVIFSLINNKSFDEDNSAIAELVILGILAGTFIVGILSLTKFRKGYDIDISDDKEKEDSEHKEKNDD